jgi:hypothetical protein
MSSDFAEIALPLSSWALFVVTKTSCVECARAIITTYQFTPVIETYSTFSHIAFNVTLLRSVVVMVGLVCLWHSTHEVAWALFVKNLLETFTLSNSFEMKFAVSVLPVVNIKHVFICE